MFFHQMSQADVVIDFLRQGGISAGSARDWRGVSAGSVWHQRILNTFEHFILTYLDNF